VQEGDLNCSHRKIAPVFEDEPRFIFSVGLAKRSIRKREGEIFHLPLSPPLPKRREIKDFICYNEKVVILKSHLKKVTF
jgi:hypothetical protein